MDETMDLVNQLVATAVVNAEFKEQIRCFKIVERINPHCGACRCTDTANYISKDEAIKLILNQ